MGTKSIDELRIFNDEEAMAIKKAFEADPKMTYVKLAENYKCKESAIRSAIYRAGGEGRGSGFLSTINYKLDKEFCEQIWKD